MMKDIIFQIRQTIIFKMMKDIIFQIRHRQLYSKWWMIVVWWTLFTGRKQFEDNTVVVGSRKSKIDWLVFNRQRAIFQLYSGRCKSKKDRQCYSQNRKNKTTKNYLQNTTQKSENHEPHWKPRMNSCCSVQLLHR